MLNAQTSSNQSHVTRSWQESHLDIYTHACVHAERVRNDETPSLLPAAKPYQKQPIANSKSCNNIICQVAKKLSRQNTNDALRNLRYRCVCAALKRAAIDNERQLLNSNSTIIRLSPILCFLVYTSARSDSKQTSFAPA